MSRINNVAISVNHGPQKEIRPGSLAELGKLLSDEAATVKGVYAEVVIRGIIGGKVTIIQTEDGLEMEVTV